MRFVASCLGLALASCAFSIPDGRLACSTERDCPSGFQCVAAHCWRDGTDAGAVDGGPQDGGPDGGARDTGPDTGRGDGGMSDGSIDAGTPDTGVDGGPTMTCPNGVRELLEDCDGTDLGTASCGSVPGGFVGGTLGCDVTCHFVTTGCHRCGNTMVDSGEDCDGTALGGASCTSIGMGFVGGALGCTSSCTFDTSACTAPPNCGNGRIDSGEDCDATLLGGGTCSTATSGSLTMGTLACTAGCRFDTSACSRCGNDTREAMEVCDGADLAGRTCADQGFPGGSLGCNATCAGFVVSGCTPPSIPTPRLPMNDAYVGNVHASGSMRPTFVWEASSFAGTGPIDYELQLSTDATFATGNVGPAPSTALTFRPASDLAVSSTAPVGARYYWRVRACVRGVCSGWSTPWWVNVGRSDRDFDGDGYADMVIGAPGVDTGATDAGQVTVFLGGPSMDGTADWTRTSTTANGHLGASAAFADLNADGFADLAVAAPDLGAVVAGGGRVLVFFGSATPDTTPEGTINGSVAGGQLGHALSRAGDVDGDGYDDLLVGASGYAMIFRGGAGATFDTTADATFADPGSGPGSFFGFEVSGGGDVDGDGRSDFVVSAWNETVGTTTHAGAVYLYYGSALPLATTPATTLSGAAAQEHRGLGVACDGDVNGDGFGDLALGANDEGAGALGSVTVYLGGRARPIDAGIDGVPRGVDFNDNLGQCVDMEGDVDGDGIDDLVVGAPGNRTAGIGGGMIFVFQGGRGTSFEDTYDYGWPASAAGEVFGQRCAVIGDVAGSGFAAVAGAAGTSAGVVRLYRGGMPPDTTADVTVTGAASGDALGAGTVR